MPICSLLDTQCGCGLAYVALPRLLPPSRFVCVTGKSPRNTLAVLQSEISELPEPVQVLLREQYLHERRGCGSPSSTEENEMMLDLVKNYLREQALEARALEAANAQVCCTRAYVNNLLPTTCAFPAIPE